MKKRILLTLICVLSAIMFFACALTCLATDLPSESVTDSGNSEASDSGFQWRDLFSRAWEFYNENKTEVLSLAGNAAVFLLTFFARRSSGLQMEKITSDLKIVKADAGGTASSQSSVVSAMNGLIGGYNQMHESYEKYGQTESDRNKLIGAVMVQNTAILDILSTVYVNSKNMPQGVKDLVNLKYANCLKTIGDDETLLAIVAAVREKIETNTESASEEEKEDTAASEV
jgi:hypothetical protein